MSDKKCNRMYSFVIQSNLIQSGYPDIVKQVRERMLFIAWERGRSRWQMRVVLNNHLLYSLRNFSFEYLPVTLNGRV